MFESEHYTSISALASIEGLGLGWVGGGGGGGVANAAIVPRAWV